VPFNASPQPLLCTIELTPISENVQAAGLAGSRNTERDIARSRRLREQVFPRQLIEGENLADLIPLMDWVGKLKLLELDVEHQKP
jgi:hypothetical protein